MAMENNILLDDLIFPLAAPLGTAPLVSTGHVWWHRVWYPYFSMQTGDIELLFVDPSILIFVEDLEPVANDHIPGEMTCKPGAKKNAAENVWGSSGQGNTEKMNHQPNRP